MRKVLLTIFLSVFIAGTTYLPFAAGFLSELGTPKIVSATATGGLGDSCTSDAECDTSTGLSCMNNKCDYENDYVGTQNDTQTGTPNNTQTGTPNNTQTGTPNNTQTGLPNVDESCPPDKLCNPLLSKYNTLCKVLQGIIDLITQVGAVIAVILIIWTGFKFITAQGNPGKLTAAKNAFLTTILGTAILLGASAIAQIVVKTVFTITNKNNPGVCSL